MIAVPIAGNKFIFLAENLSVGTNADKKAFTINLVYEFLQNISVAQIMLSRSCLHSGWYRKPLPPTTISHHHFSQFTCFGTQRGISQSPCPPITSFMREGNIALLQVAILAFALAFLFRILTLGLYASEEKARGRKLIRVFCRGHGLRRNG
jgi:hypothetical protein